MSITNTTDHLAHNDLNAWLLLGLTHGVGPKLFIKLLEHFNTVENILQQDITTISKLTNPTTAKLICERSATKAAEHALAWQSQNNKRYIMNLRDPLYPKELSAINTPPPLLYLEGNFDLLNNPKLAIVGTRHPTKQGCENAFKFAKDLANNNFTIVSGMALGIDKYAHLGAIDGKSSTIGVIGTGIDVRYPKSNYDLYSKVLDANGLIISEFPLGTQPAISNFPRRNRIIAGLSLGCLVIESTIDGGSMISANYALEMGREVMAIPGSIHNPVTRGCHRLIKNGAKLIENTNDILEEFDFKYSIIQQNQAITDPLLIAMGFDPIGIDRICANLNVDFSEICAKLLDFELSGKIVNCGNGNYQRIFN